MFLLRPPRPFVLTKWQRNKWHASSYQNMLHSVRINLPNLLVAHLDLTTINLPNKIHMTQTGCNSIIFVIESIISVVFQLLNSLVSHHAHPRFYSDHHFFRAIYDYVKDKINLKIWCWTFDCDHYCSFETVILHYNDDVKNSILKKMC